MCANCEHKKRAIIIYGPAKFTTQSTARRTLSANVRDENNYRQEHNWPVYGGHV